MERSPAFSCDVTVSRDGSMSASTGTTGTAARAVTPRTVRGTLGLEIVTVVATATTGASDPAWVAALTFHATGKANS